MASNFGRNEYNIDLTPENSSSPSKELMPAIIFFLILAVVTAI